jgi:hypothetical protein
MIKSTLFSRLSQVRDEVNERFLSRQTVKFTKMTEIDLE